MIDIFTVGAGEIVFESKSLTVIVNVISGIVMVGVPLIVPVAVSKVNPVGREL